MKPHISFSARLAALLLPVLFCCASSAHAQGATLSGQVTDSAGAAVSAATVVVQEASTGLETTAATNDAGYYQFPPLQPGVYKLDIKVANFAGHYTG